MKKCLSEEKIELFIKKRTNKKETREIKEHLLKCKKCYEKYIEYKELLYFKEKKGHINSKFIKEIINLYDEYSNTKRFTIILKATKKAIEIFTDTNFELKSDFVSATLVTKGDTQKKVEGDIITLSKTIDSYNVFLTIQKIKNMKFQVGVNIYKKTSKSKLKNIRVILKCGKQEIENIHLKEREQFEYLLEPDNYTLEFYKKENLLFIVDLKIKSE